MVFLGHVVLGLATATGVLALPAKSAVWRRETNATLTIRLSIADGLLAGATDGHVNVLFATAGVDPLEDTDVTSTPDKIFGRNAFKVTANDTIILSGGDGNHTDVDVYGFPIVGLNEVPAGDYSVQAFFTRYETASRSDGSVVTVRFPCRDGALNIDAPGSLASSATNVSVQTGVQTIDLSLDSIIPTENFTGTEVGGCNQGDYEDTATLKHIKIRSDALSKFWGRDMFVGANIKLPAGYSTSTDRYPVLYSQNHWTGGDWGLENLQQGFEAQWDAGIIPGKNGSADRPAPKIIVVAFRHETPFYDDSYGVNTANIGPYGDAINDELVPVIESTFRTIQAPWARVQEGGSTGGWISAATTIFRPDLYGATFSSYPDSLDFHRHQDIPLYDAANAYTRPDGSKIPSIRTFINNTEVIEATTEQENHWELSFGTSTRSFLQWDVWNAVFGAQGYNNYPLEPWDKVTGEIYPDAVSYWRGFDLADYILTNWNSSKALGTNLRNRLFFYVGGRDTYFLNEGVQQFQSRVEALGGPGWANFSYIADRPHGGTYNHLDLWNFIELVYEWMVDHAPNGKTPLSPQVTVPSARGNFWEDVIAKGGHGAALARQQSPEVLPPVKSCVGNIVSASVGRWDPGVKLVAKWVIDGRPVGETGFVVQNGATVQYQRGLRGCEVLIEVTGTKRGYKTETRRSKPVRLD